MKALSVRQPWASLIASGQKTVEVRTWSTTFRGPLLICASKTRNIDGLPIGVALCTVDLVDCRPILSSDASGACCGVDPSREFAWVLANPQPIEELTPVSGRLRLFDVAIARAG